MVRRKHQYRQENDLQYRQCAPSQNHFVFLNVRKGQLPRQTIVVILTLWEILSLPADLFQSELGVRAEVLPEHSIAQTTLATRIATILPKTDIAQQVKTLSVLIQSQVGSGSGVIIQHQGQTYTVVTAAHVVATPNILYTRLPELGSPHLSSGGGKATKRLQPL
jgi:hypothetical protein